MAQDQPEEERTKLWGQVVAKAWRDPAFKQRLLADSPTVLREHGIEIPTGMQLQVVENTDEFYHLVLPPKPEAELSDEQLDQVAGGVRCCHTQGFMSCQCA